MDIELLESQAIVGDVDAMLELAVLLTRTERYDEALEWAERASAEGEPLGHYRAVILLTKLMGKALQSKDWETVLERAHAICSHSITLVSQQSSGEIDLTQESLGTLSACFAEGRYYFALASYCKNDGSMEDALSHLVNARSTRDLLLRQLILLELDDPRFSVDEILECLGDREYVAAEKSGAEELIFAVGALTVSGDLQGNGHADKAVNLLDCTIRLLSDPDALRILREERALYRKRLFGGWKYTGD